MREKTPEQLSIFDILDDVEKPRDFFMPDSFSGSIKGQTLETLAFEKVKYLGNENLKNNLYTIYIRQIKKQDESPENSRYIVSVPQINFDFGYNSLEKLLSEWDLKKEQIMNNP